MQLPQDQCYPLVHYLITHNVSSEQLAITINRTNVTLYGVQPGQTYTVAISPYFLDKKGEPHYFFSSYIISYQAKITTPTANTPAPSVISECKYNRLILVNAKGQVLADCTVWSHDPARHSPHAVCSHQSTQSWTVVMIAVPWVLLVVGVAAAVIACTYKKGKLWYTIVFIVYYTCILNFVGTTRIIFLLALITLQKILTKVTNHMIIIMLS